MPERRRKGIAKAKRKGRYKGRVLGHSEGVRQSKIAVRLGIGRASGPSWLKAIRRDIHGRTLGSQRAATLLMSFP